MADAPLNPRPRASGVGPVDLDDVSQSSEDSEETFEEPRFLCTPRGRLLTLFCVLLLAAVGIALGVTQPWSEGEGGTADLQSLGDNTSGYDDDYYNNDTWPSWSSSLMPSPRPTYWWQRTPPPSPGNGGSGSQPSTPAPFPTFPSPKVPTPFPVQPPTRPPLSAGDYERYQSFREVILSAGATPSGKVATSPVVAISVTATTPQQKALNWIAFDDPLQLDADAEPVLRVTQRYAAAVLYYGMAGENWNDNTDWLGPKHECDWYGLSCEERQILAHSQAGGTVNELMVNEINLNENNLLGLVPGEISAFPWMDTLGLYSNLLGGKLTSNIGLLTRLERLWLDDNFFQGTIPTELGRLIALKQVDMFKNNFSGQLPSEIGNLGNLTRFSVYDNKLKGTLPPELGNMKELKEIFLDTNEISGTIPGELGGAVKLEDLRLFQNKLSGPLSGPLSGLSALRILYVDNNDLTGISPTAVAGWTSLVDLQVFDNDIGSSLPAEFGELSNLAVIAMANNGIGGVLPSSLCQAGSKLLKLDLSDNLLSGPIPNSISECSSLLRLHLDQNQMASSIPPQIGQLNELKSLYLNNNKLSGSIPSEIKNMASLEELHVERNELVGSVPFELCGKLTSIQADCEGFNAQVVCTCCTLCCGTNGCLAPNAVPQLAKALVP